MKFGAAFLCAEKTVEFALIFLWLITSKNAEYRSTIPFPKMVAGLYCRLHYTEKHGIF